ncbi:MAG TPA: DMT family transporter [Pseudolabrys sp.]|nr:DMT family transporter [Pseudolabrys sp.]
MSGDEDKASAKRGWIHDNPYLLLALAALFWSGNHIVGRAIGGKVPPIGISTVRWLLPTVAIGFLAFPHIRRDWPVIRAHWGILLWLGIVGGALFTAGQYIGLQYTTALNVSVLNSLVPVLIIATGGLIFRDRVTIVQFGGILMSSLGVLVIISRGQLTNLQYLQVNWGDIIILFNMMVFAVYAVYLRKRPQMHWLSFIFVFGAVSAVATLPFMIWEMAAGITFKATWLTIFAIAYVSIFPSLLAFAAWNRGVQLIGANRSGPFVHLVPVYTAILGGVLLNEHLSTFHIFGAALIIAGVWIAARFSSST